MALSVDLSDFQNNPTASQHMDGFVGYDCRLNIVICHVGALAPMNVYNGPPGIIGEYHGLLRDREVDH